MNIDLKTLMTFISLLVGIILIMGPKLKEWGLLLSNFSKTESQVPQPVVIDNKAYNDSVTSLDCLVSLVHDLDKVENKETVDLLIDKVAPTLIRKRISNLK